MVYGKLLFFRYGDCSVYEIYPQSETPQLTQIAHLDFYRTSDSSACLLPGTVIWYDFYEDRIVFRVWDYRLNHSIIFSADFDGYYQFANPKVYYLIISKALKLAFLTRTSVGIGDENCCDRPI
jgi:hypothetical protein